MTVVPGKGCDASSKISLKRSKKSINGGIKAGVVSSEIQQNDGTSIEHLLATLVPSLQNIAVEDDKGNKDSDLFKLLGDTLVGDAQNIFQDCLKQGNWDDTMKSQKGAFNRFLAAYLKKYTNSTNMKDTMFRYLEHGAKKPYDQPPGDFLRRFNLLYQSSQYFEGKKKLPSDDELKDWYMSCYPKTHVLQYAKNKDYDDQDIEEITQYMGMLHQEEVNNGSIAKWKQQREKGKKRKHDDDDSRSRRSGKSSRDSHRRERRYGDKRSGNGSSRSGGLRYTDPCPNHPDHDHVWGKCRLNPRNKDKDDSSKRRKKDHDHKAHSHYQDDDDSSDDDSYATAYSGSSASDSNDSSSNKTDTSEEKPRRKKSPKKKKTKNKQKKSSRSKDHSHTIQRKASAESALSADGQGLFGDE